jgi:hypothetical protein
MQDLVGVLDIKHESHLDLLLLFEVFFDWIDARRNIEEGHYAVASSYSRSMLVLETAGVRSRRQIQCICVKCVITVCCKYVTGPLQSLDCGFESHPNKCNCGLITTHCNYSCVLVRSILNMATRMAETCR